MHIVHHAVCIARHLGAGHGKQRVSAVPKSRSRAQRHQGVHIGRPVPQALKAADKKATVDDHNHNGQQHLEQPHGNVVAL